MKMQIDKEWFGKRAAAEGDHEIGAGGNRKGFCSIDRLLVLVSRGAGTDRRANADRYRNLYKSRVPVATGRLSGGDD